MWIEEVTLENVKCFQSQTIKLGDDGKPYPWVTFLGENGTGKTTVLQAIGLLLAGEEGAKRLGFWADGWTKEGMSVSNVEAELVIGQHDPYPKVESAIYRNPSTIRLRQSFIVIGKNGSKGDRFTTAGTVIETYDYDDFLFRQDSLFSEDITGWFAAGYGAFRRLAKEGAFGSKRPDFLRRENFKALFNEDFPIETFESWLMYLDHVILKNQSPLDKLHLEITKSAINSLLPEGNTIEGADIDGKVYFNTQQGRVPTIALSDGFRSILALAGDLIWRMIQAFPESKKPLEEQGVVLIDEIDIHLHPKWQRSIAGLLRKTFPNVQFIVATHSPIVAAGAGHDAVTYGFYQEGDQTKVERLEHVWAQSVDDILTSRAFGLVSEFSEETQGQIDTYLKLRDKKKRSQEEEASYQSTIPFVREALGPGMEKTSLELEIDAYIKEHVK